MFKVLFNGVYKEVVVDDYIPVDKNNWPVFAQPSNAV